MKSKSIFNYSNHIALHCYILFKVYDIELRRLVTSASVANLYLFAWRHWIWLQRNISVLFMNLRLTLLKFHNPIEIWKIVLNSRIARVKTASSLMKGVFKDISRSFHHKKTKYGRVFLGTVVTTLVPELLLKKNDDQYFPNRW